MQVLKQAAHQNNYYLYHHLTYQDLRSLYNCISIPPISLALALSLALTILFSTTIFVVNFSIVMKTTFCRSS